MKVPFSIDGNKFAGMQYACGKPNFIKLLSRKNLEFLQANQTNLWNSEHKTIVNVGGNSMIKQSMKSVTCKKWDIAANDYYQSTT